MSAVVALARNAEARYPARTPFHPEQCYPEFRAAGLLATHAADTKNDVYPLVRNCLQLLGLDAERLGTPAWNPFTDIVTPGSRVVLKPNFVLHERGEQRGRQCLITHASVLRAIIDYVLLAGGLDCRIAVVDSPLQQAEFDTILRDSGLDSVIEYYRRGGVTIETIDLRRTRVVVDDHRVIRSTHELSGDPRGYVTVRLGGASHLEPITSEGTQFAVTDYDRGEMTLHHRPGHHEYLISRSVLEADVFINVPKLKTHQKVGVTLALKNLVGINGSKDWLPHYRPGSPSEGGDEFSRRSLLNSLHSSVRSVLQGRNPRAMRAAQVVWHGYRRIFEGRSRDSSNDQETGSRTLSGAWHGNDTTWRMVVDLNRALFHAANDGTLGNRPPRRYLAFVDGIVGGDGDGPLSPAARPVGLIAGSIDPVALDRVCAYLMGFEPDQLPMLTDPLKPSDYRITTLNKGDQPDVHASPSDWRNWHFEFRPAPGWRGQIERPIANLTASVIS